MSARSYLKGGLILSGGSVLSAACSFARNIIIARLISVEDFGIAATFAMTMSLVEMASNLALDRLLVQAPDGYAPRMLATAHAFQVFRGVLGTVVLFLLAGPIAELLKIPEVAWAFRIVAVVPLLRSLMHLDATCQQREMRFAASVWLDTTPQVVTTLAAAPLALWLGDYRVMLFMVVGQVAIMTLVSHLVAGRPYRWAWDRVIIGRMLRFGWPLLINGMLLFGVMHGERLVVGTFIDMNALAVFSVALILAMTPALVAAKVLRTYLLPLLAAKQEERLAFLRRYRATAELCLVAAASFGVLLIHSNGALIHVSYGERYADAASVLPWLALLNSIRLLRVAPTNAAVALASTGNPMMANLCRIVGLAVAAGVAASGGEMHTIAMIAAFGEMSAFFTSLLLLRWRCKIPLTWPFAASFVGALLMLGAAFAGTRHITWGGTPFSQLVLSVVLAGVTASILFALSATLRVELLTKEPRSKKKVIVTT